MNADASWVAVAGYHQRVAKKCELRWDTPGLGPDPSTVPDELAEERSWTDPEREAINAALAAHHTQMIEQIRALYVEATGDPNAGSMSPQAMMAEINDKTPVQEIRGTYQRLAQERAQMIEPPEQLEGRSVTERLYRLLLSAGDGAERAVADKVGDEMAEQVREFKDGFGSKHRSSYGCPQ